MFYNNVRKILLFVFVLYLTVFANLDTVIIVHKNYTTSFDTIKHYPILVQWVLTRDKVLCQNKLKRTNKFVPDPKLHVYTDLNKDYIKSGYDRGHNMPADNNECNKQSLDECFYYSNMTPQTPTLNRGIWESLEDHTLDLTKQYDSIKVWCGSIGEIKKIGKVSVPCKCWKAIFIKSQSKYEAYIFNNDTVKSYDLKSHLISMDSLYSLTGLILR